MESVWELPEGVTGAAGDDLVDGYGLALEAWGPGADQDNSSLTAFAYLWRRFGPPWLGSDDHKDLARWVLTTADPEVWLVMSPGSCGICYGAAYLSTRAIQDECARPFVEWESAFKEWWCDQQTDVDWDHWETATDEQRKTVSERFWKERCQDDICKRAVDVIGPFPPRQRTDDWRNGSPVVQRVNGALFDAMRDLLRPVGIRDQAFNLLGFGESQGEGVRRSRYAGFGLGDTKVALDRMADEEEARYGR